MSRPPIKRPGKPDIPAPPEHLSREEQDALVTWAANHDHRAEDERLELIRKRYDEHQPPAVGGVVKKK